MLKVHDILIEGKVKEETEVSELCQNQPWEFGVYLRYCRNLRFAQKPDYNYLRLLFRGCLKRFIGYFMLMGLSL